MAQKPITCTCCGEKMVRAGTVIYCPNGCYEDDLRNYEIEQDI